MFDVVYTESILRIIANDNYKCIAGLALLKQQDKERCKPL